MMLPGKMEQLGAPSWASTTIYGGLLGLSEHEISRIQAEGVI